jgi:hypothetical protein
MHNKYHIEIGEDCKSSRCHCCGKESCVGHGFVSKDGDAYAVYYAGWSNAHLEKKVTFAIAVGEWQDGSTPSDRVCFGLEAYEAENKILFRVIEPSESPWRDTDLLGKMISRDEGLKHPFLEEIFIIIENIVRKHTAVREYLNMSEEFEF